jgi:class 3 adenylate cyclase
LGEEVQSYILKLDPSLSPSKGDVFEFNWQQVTVADNAAGLKWKGKYPSFPEYLVQRHFWNLGFLLVLIYVAYLGGFRVFYLRFESKVFVRYFLFLGVLYLCLLYLERYIHRGTLLLDHQRAEEAWESSVKQLDRGFQTYLEELGSRVRYSFKNKNPLNDDTLYKDGLHALLLSPPSNATQSSTKIDSFSSTYLLRLTLSLAATHFSLGEAGSRADKPVANELEVYKSNLLVRTAISRQYEIEKLESKVPTWVKSADDSDPYFAENIFDEGVKILGQKGEWLHHQVLMIKQYFLGLIENTAEGPRVLGATINAGSAFLRYLEEAAFSEGNPLAGGVFMVQSADGQLFTFPRAEQWDREFFEEHWNRTRLSSEGSIRIEVNSKNYLGTFYPSEAVGSFRYLILQSEDEVLRTSNELKKRFANFHIWFWIFGLLFSVFLARVIIRPLEVLREGFQKLRAKNFDFSLSIRGVDEGSQMIQGFNEMVVGLAQKEKMIPYVNAALQDLLEKKSDSEDSELYSGRAIVLMSDIRSFTTLSEERNPEEVVEMLGEYFGFWQTRVERYQGVIERFIGDAVVALFFEKNSRHFVQQALQCSLEVQHDLRAWNKARKARGLFAVKNGVGLALGEIAFDLVGTAERMEFLSIGEPIERAELLETKTKAGTSTDIFVDYQVEKELRGLYDFEKRGELSRGETYFEVIEGEE